jgi:anti-sigma B factor antagonist
MKLTLQSQVTDDDVAVIRCKGRISFGAEVDALEAEVNKLTKVPGTNIFEVKQVVLQLAETDYIDSSGLGALVRLLGVLNSAGGGLKLCQMSPTVLKVMEITNLNTLFPAHASEAEAINAFSHAPRSQGDKFGSAKTRIVCVDTSSNLLAGLNGLLTSSGYEVFVTRFVGEATTLVKAIRPKVVICGPGVLASPVGPEAIAKFRQNAGLQILQLPPDFQTTEAGQAGQELVAQVQSLAAI